MAARHVVGVGDQGTVYPGLELDPLPRDKTEEEINAILFHGVPRLPHDKTESEIERILFHGLEPRYDDSQRANMRGVNVDKSGVEYPRVSQEDFRKLVMAKGEVNDDVLTRVLGQFCLPSSEAYKDYCATRVGRRMPRDDGNGDHTVGKVAVPRYVPPWERRLIAQKEKKDQDEGKKVKRYTLSAVLVDTYVRKKYQIPLRVINGVTNMAISSPADAAATMQDWMQRMSTGGVKILVDAASYAAGFGAAKRSIALMARAVPEPQVNVPAAVIGAEMFVYGGENKEWCVKGPLEHATTIYQVYKLAVHGGQHETIYLFAEETAKLRIDIFIGDKCVSPTVIGHVGEVGEAQRLSSDETEFLLTGVALKRRDQLKVNVMSVCDEGNHVATALQFERRVGLINQHVFDAAGGTLTVNGAELGKVSVVGLDVWAFSSERRCESWSFREPLVGERVCIFYHNGSEAVLSPSFEVQAVDGMQILSEMTSSIGSGMSGGAVVALSDFALLGVHSGATVRNLIATRITQSVYDDLCEYGDAIQESRSIDDGTSEAVINIFRSRGYGSQFRTIVKSLKPVMHGEFSVGSAVQVEESKALTTCTEGEVLGFPLVRNGLLSEVVVPGDSVVPWVRQAQLSESVVVVGTDDEGPFNTGQLEVKHVGPFGKNFILTAPEHVLFPLTGGVVISAQDCSVLGLVVRYAVNDKAGAHIFCVSVPRSSAPATDVVSELERLFPKLGVRSWSHEDLEMVFTHSSRGGKDVSNEKFSRLGDAYIKWKLLSNLHASDVPICHWQEYLITLQNNTRLAKIAEDLGLDKFLRTQSGLVLGKGAKAHADMLEALCGLASESVGAQVVEEWLDTMGIAPAPGSFKGPKSEYSRFMRRPSELGLLNASGQLLMPVD